ncbi:hypothetical protein [Paracidovorax cattleyae]|uniref:Uncharacterized protein n=1 Tax=Paracidovorax cattleyae TaxID=80868 RepID=A0A1H0N1I4_9BURK|nr:hypothetical protein [Paracidovorax cattleyae]AVS75643.1 hypothetical protein C8240_18100 [Paracidovorax cattleyae]SDO86385.1 hypothetical protein SAMN04489708_104154 [Paracidovorax cattleyae]
MAHTTTTAAAAAPKPEALRCAEWLEHIARGAEVVTIEGLAGEAAAQLRRLHALTAAPAAQEADPAPLPMETAPKDGTMVLLLVEHDGTSFEDSDEPGWTIGFNNLGNTGEDTWQFAGWDWCQDNYTQGVGKPVAWLPMLAAAAPQESDAAIMDAMVDKAWGRFEAEMQRQTARAAVAPALLEGRAHLTYKLTAESGYEQTGEHHNITPEIFGAMTAALHSTAESVLIDGVAYLIPAPVAAELLRLHLEVLPNAAEVAPRPASLERMKKWERSGELAERMWGACMDLERENAALKRDAANLRDALTIAVDHIDMEALRISHCKDSATIDAALSNPDAKEPRP